ncbi:MAG: peptidoglycan DD-metalloendopeptidase family protein [Steroidobacteraceae bacterium]
MRLFRPAIVSCSLFVLALAVNDRYPQPEPIPNIAQAPVAALTPQAASMAEPFSSIEVIVRRNDTLDAIFRKLALSLTDLANLRALSGARALIDRLVPGEALHLTHRNGELLTLERNLSLTEQLKVTRAADGFRADVSARPIEPRVVVAHGVIDSSLFDSAQDAGMQDQTVLQLAQIFGWDIDFALDLRPGDEFTVSYQRLYQHGVYLQDGPILAARFTNQGREVRAVRYRSADGSERYYSPDGRSMQKAFLRAPLEFRRVSSKFSRARYHPILDLVRAHQGVDYAAPSGTPVRAAGNGRVRFCGRRGGYGNLVEIDHGGGIVTVYGHLSRFATSTRVGARVQQGQTIAYVGMTGLATGPHLHYEYRLNGRYLDPQHVKLPDATPLDASLRADFTRQTAPYLAAIELQPAAAPATTAR